MNVGTWLAALRLLHGVRYLLTLGHDLLIWLAFGEKMVKFLVKGSSWRVEYMTI